ncbi:MAG: hypothetical protein CMN30_20695 [Sandaracinus sp.]|nr:hypothetical protein [Sandaracinus sp.]|tara:strand:- start:546 stop:1034 length:489 start_codon:yes stop_codon:yes gene_type:complete
MRILPTFALAATLLTFSCGDEVETFGLSFPSVEAFAAAETARVFAMPVSDADGACFDLLFQVENVGPPEGAQDTGPIPVCQFREGGVELPSVGDGLLAYVATATDVDGRVLLSGCTLRDVYTDADGVRIVLTPTDVYRELLDEPDYEPTGCSVESRCGGSCR